MGATLDGQDLFDGQQLKIEIGSLRRDSIERAVPGLDGTISIDLGCRGRKVKQTGVLRAESRSRIRERISSISAFIDGNTHTLKSDDGEELCNLRMDTFEAGQEKISGSGVYCDYKIIYTQLVV